MYGIVEGIIELCTAHVDFLTKRGGCDLIVQMVIDILIQLHDKASPVETHDFTVHDLTVAGLHKMGDGENLFFGPEIDL